MSNKISKIKIYKKNESIKVENLETKTKNELLYKINNDYAYILDVTKPIDVYIDDIIVSPTKYIVDAANGTILFKNKTTGIVTISGYYVTTVFFDLVDSYKVDAENEVNKISVLNLENQLVYEKTKNKSGSISKYIGTAEDDIIYDDYIDNATPFLIAFDNSIIKNNWIIFTKKSKNITSDDAIKIDLDFYII